VRPSDLDRSLRFYSDLLGLAVYREFGPPDHPGTVFFLGPGLLEVSGQTAGPAGRAAVMSRARGAIPPERPTPSGR
jgi:catechol 2,3-dioxygenase-like lactoylglutathione lyase family enzyme